MAERTTAATASSVAFGAILGGSILAAALAETSGRAIVLGDRRDAFVEREDGRRVAEIDAALVHDGRATRLVLRVSALGTGVDALPGWEGVPGANLRTAEEMTRLLEEGSLSARLVGEETGIRVRAAVRVARRGAVPMRRLDAAGRLRLDERTRERLVTSIEVASDPLPPERMRVEVLVAGVARLTGEVDPRRAALGPFRETGGLHRDLGRRP
jgi:hypothetical protein